MLLPINLIRQFVPKKAMLAKQGVKLNFYFMRCKRILNASSLQTRTSLGLI